MFKKIPSMRTEGMAINEKMTGAPFTVPKSSFPVMYIENNASRAKNIPVKRMKPGKNILIKFPKLNAPKWFMSSPFHCHLFFNRRRSINDKNLHWGSS